MHGEINWLFGENQGLYLIVCEKKNEKLITDRAKSNEIPIQTLGQFKDELFQIGKENIKVKELKTIFDKGLDDLFN